MIVKFLFPAISSSSSSSSPPAAPGCPSSSAVNFFQAVADATIDDLFLNAEFSVESLVLIGTDSTPNVLWFQGDGVLLSKKFCDII
jgi:hypothetical protein